MTQRRTSACWLWFWAGLTAPAAQARAHAEAPASPSSELPAAPPLPQPAATTAGEQTGVVELVLPPPAANAAAQPSPDEQRARICFEAAKAAYLAGRLEDARQGFECAYAELPSPELAWNLARVYERTGAVEQGVRFYQEYLAHARVTPRERRNIENRINALRDLQARQSLQSIQLKSGPASAELLSSEARAFFLRGLKLYRGAHFAAAAAAFTTALQLSGAPELHYNLALTSQRLGSQRDAIDHYGAYLAALPSAPDRADVEARMASLRAQLP